MNLRLSIALCALVAVNATAQVTTSAWKFVKDVGQTGAVNLVGAPVYVATPTAGSNAVPLSYLGTWGSSNLTIGGTFSGDSVSNVFYMVFPPYAISTNSEPLFMPQGFDGNRLDVWKQRRDATSWWVAAHNGSAFETNYYKLSYVLPAIWSNQTYVSVAPPIPPVVSNYPYSGNIVAQWDFQDLTGSVTSDSTSNDLDLTISGATWTNISVSSLGYTNKAYYYDGINDYLARTVTTNTATSLWASTVGTISVWFKIKTPATATGYSSFGFFSGYTASATLGWENAAGSNQTFRMYTPGAVSVSSTGESFSGDVWKNWQIVYTGKGSGQGIFQYIDGTLSASNVVDADRADWFYSLANSVIGSNSYYLVVNANVALATRHWEGLCDNAVIWNVPLTNAADRATVIAVSHPTNDLHIGVQP